MLNAKQTRLGKLADVKRRGKSKEQFMQQIIAGDRGCGFLHAVSATLVRDILQPGNDRKCQEDDIFKTLVSTVS